jgi:hypothetical protein
MGSFSKDNRDNNNGKNVYQAIMSPVTYVFGDEIGGAIDPLNNMGAHSVQNSNNWIMGYHDPKGTTYVGNNNINSWLRKNVGGYFDSKEGQYYKHWDAYYTNKQRMASDLINANNQETPYGTPRNVTQFDSSSSTPKKLEDLDPSSQYLDTSVPESKYSAESFQKNSWGAGSSSFDDNKTYTSSVLNGE